MEDQEDTTTDAVSAETVEENPIMNLTKEQIEKLGMQKTVSNFKQNKLELDACKNWDLFYKRNGTRFFKDRHWTSREFCELIENADNELARGKIKQNLLEIGCGVGNTLFPLLEETTDLFIYACDFSPRAIQLVKENPNYDSTRCHAFQCDLTKDCLTDAILPNSIDFVTIIFVMSAILPSKMPHVISNINKILKPGGIVLFRDYGIYDHAMLRFSRGHKIDDNFYFRQDGTRSFFFSIEKVSELFQDFNIVENKYTKRLTVNKKEDIEVPRIFVQGRPETAALLLMWDYRTEARVLSDFVYTEVHQVKKKYLRNLVTQPSTLIPGL
eukprot:gene3818-4349_t